MNTRVYFEPFTPGMKARLDPTYRQKQQDNSLLLAVPPREITRDSRHSLLPFTTASKNNRIIDRLI
jgi:hypothetical protein